MKNIFTKSIFAILLLIIFLGLAGTSFAYDYTVLAPIDGANYTTVYERKSTLGIWEPCAEGSVGCIERIKMSTANGGLGNYINTLYKIAVAGASVLAVLMLIMGGFTYVSTDAIGNKEQGKEDIKMALGGLLLVLVSWVILNTINPQLVKLNITSEALESRNLGDVLNASRAFATRASLTLAQDTQRMINSSPNSALIPSTVTQQILDLSNGANKITADADEVYYAYSVGEISEEEALDYLGEITSKSYTSIENALDDIEWTASNLNTQAHAMNAALDAKTFFDNNTAVSTRTPGTAIQQARDIQSIYNATVERINNLPTEYLSQEEKNKILNKVHINGLGTLNTLCANLNANGGTSEQFNNCSSVRLSPPVTNPNP